MHGGIFHREENKSDQRNASHAVSFKPVSAGANGVAGVVSRAVGNDTGIARVVFLDFEHDLHEVGADIRDLSKDAAGDAQRGSAKRFANGESDEARTGEIARNEQQNEEHHHQLDADQHHADAHAGLQRRAVNRIGFAAQGSERRARIGKRIDTNAEPRHAVTARNPDQTENQNNRQSDRNRLHRGKPAKVHNDHDRDKHPQNQQEFSLRNEIGFAGLVNQLGDIPHGLVNGQVFQARING